jgi:hypothetical protein
MAEIITQKVIERPKDVQPARIKERKEPVPLVIRNYRNYLAYNSSNVTWMQILKFNNNESFRTSISHQHNLPLCRES